MVKKFRYKFLAAGSCSRWLATTAALPGLNWTALNSASNVLRLPSPPFPPVGKKTMLVKKCQIPIIARNFFHANAKKCSASEAMPSCTNAKPDPASSFLSASSSLYPA